MTRYNLWVTIDDHSKVVCFGPLSEMNDLALQAGIRGDVCVLPDGDEPEPIPKCKSPLP